MKVPALQTIAMGHTDVFASTDLLDTIAKNVRKLLHLHNSLILHVPDIYINYKF